jgi:ABC-2 type transport system ATP-binding protein
MAAVDRGLLTPAGLPLGSSSPNRAALASALIPVASGLARVHYALMAALKVEHLVKRYGSVTILHDVSLEVPDHSLFGLLGLNGAGKTTTLHCALGLARPTSGTATVLGLSSREIHRTHGRVGVLFDASTNFAQLSVRQNLEVARQLIGSNGGSHASGRRASGRSRPRVGPAREEALVRHAATPRASRGALLGTPELVIMDEPLSGLDAEGVDQVLDLTRRLHREEGVTFILLSHRLHELETIVTDVALIHGGKVMVAGRLGEVLGGSDHAVLIRVDRRARRGPSSPRRRRSPRWSRTATAACACPGRARPPTSIRRCSGPVSACRSWRR